MPANLVLKTSQSLNDMARPRETKLDEEWARVLVDGLEKVTTVCWRGLLDLEGLHVPMKN